jgi:hypothetical protein
MTPIYFLGVSYYYQDEGFELAYIRYCRVQQKQISGLPHRILLIHWAL